MVKLKFDLSKNISTDIDKTAILYTYTIHKKTEIKM